MRRGEDRKDKRREGERKAKGIKTVMEKGTERRLGKMESRRETKSHKYVHVFTQTSHILPARCGTLFLPQRPAFRNHYML